MLVASKENALHKSIMLRVLINILDDSFLSSSLFFKGGTCASLLNYLDRFSVDLDFDLKDQKLKSTVIKNLETLFFKLDLKIKDRSKNVIQYFLGYDAPQKTRNTLKIDVVETSNKNNKYDTLLLGEINRYAICQTKETMFANKLIALTGRYEKSGSVAGRDLYDIHFFLTKGYDFDKEIIEEVTKQNCKDYIKSLIGFIEKNINQTIIDQDLNLLLDYKKFIAIRKTIKEETMYLLRDVV